MFTNNHCYIDPLWLSFNTCRRKKMHESATLMHKQFRIGHKDFYEDA